MVNYLLSTKPEDPVSLVLFKIGHMIQFLESETKGKNVESISKKD